MIDCHFYLQISKEWRVSSDDASVPEDENNIAYKAALTFNYYGIDPLLYFLDLKIEKRIQLPVRWCSSDAAATLRLLNALLSRRCFRIHAGFIWRTKWSGCALQLSFSRERDR